MGTVLVFALALFAAVLISARANRGLLSTAVLFLGAGLLAGATHAVPLPTEDQVQMTAELALVTSLFTDGAKVDLRQLRRSPSLPLRALFIGLPLTLLATALFARAIFELPWIAALLVATALAPTDPVFAGALVGSEHVPRRLRRLLNVESGMNDGLTVPILVILLAAGAGRHESLLALAGEVLLGIAFGAAVASIGVFIYRRGPFEASSTYKPMFALTVLLVAWSGSRLIHANEFLASFSSGVVLANVSERARASWEKPGESVTEIVKLGAVLLFGAAISQEGGIVALGWQGVVFVLAALFVARPAAIAAALVRADLGKHEKIVTAWFGPRGFASIVFALMIRSSGVKDAVMLSDIVAIVVIASIVLHSSTDSAVAKHFQSRRGTTDAAGAAGGG